MSETLLVYVPDLGQGVSFYQALGLALEELLPEREALLSPIEGPLLLLRPGELRPLMNKIAGRAPRVTGETTLRGHWREDQCAPL